MKDVQRLIPQHKSDTARAYAAVEAGYPAVGPILPELLEWLQDCNWPVAHILAPFLASIGTPLIPHIQHILNTDDDIWKYWVVEEIMRASPELATAFRKDLERIAWFPTKREVREELDQVAREVLEEYGWVREAPGPDVRVAILGAGALGSFFATQFYNAPGYSTVLVARGERYTRLKNGGLVVNGKPYAIPVLHPDEAASPADLIIVALKSYHLPGAVHDLQKLVGERTTILSVMNGLDSEADIGAVYGMDKVLYAVSVGIDAVRQENRVTFTKPGKLYFGEATNTPPSERVRRVQALLNRAGIAHETPADMIRTLWWKFMINVGVNQASAAMRASYGTFQSSPEAQALMEALMQEAIALAEAERVDLTEQDVKDWYGFMNTLSPTGKTSMLQDIAAGRKTEVEIFAGKVVELGAKHGIPTPVNQTVLRIIHVLEHQAGGANGSQ